MRGLPFRRGIRPSIRRIVASLKSEVGGHGRGETRRRDSRPLPTNSIPFHWIAKQRSLNLTREIATACPSFPEVVVDVAKEYRSSPVPFDRRQGKFNRKCQLSRRIGYRFLRKRILPWPSVRVYLCTCVRKIATGAKRDGRRQQNTTIWMAEYWIQRWNNEWRYRVAVAANYSRRNVEPTRDVNITRAALVGEKTRRDCFNGTTWIACW